MSFIEITDVTKAFGATQALAGASMTLEKGTIHGLCGANGAGKSTLIRMLAGATRPDSGVISLDGRAVSEFSPQHAMSLGIGVVHQELALVPELPVYKNIFLGAEHARAFWLNATTMKQSAARILGRMGVEIDVGERVGQLGLHQQQMVEIAKALCRGTSVLILDEPTAILNGTEKHRLYTVMRELKRAGLCILFVTHFIEELLEVCDVVTIMRDGRTVQTVATSNTDRRSLVLGMVGQIADYEMAASAASEREPVLEMRAGSVRRHFHDVTLAVRPGEIVGLAGLVGSGCHEVAETFFGLRRLDRGEIRLTGRHVRLNSPRSAVRAGIGFVPEDRRKKGLCLNLSSCMNTALAALSDRRMSRAGIINNAAVRRAFTVLSEALRLRPSDPQLLAANFSGGNQQKLVIGKWLEKGCRAYIFVEPTRGVDVGAKAEIWKIIERLAHEGSAIVLVSTDFDDITAVCGRCLVFVSGTVVGELPKPQLTKKNLSAMSLEETHGSEDKAV